MIMKTLSVDEFRRGYPNSPRDLREAVRHAVIHEYVLSLGYTERDYELTHISVIGGHHPKRLEGDLWRFIQHREIWRPGVVLTRASFYLTSQESDRDWVLVMESQTEGMDFPHTWIFEYRLLP